MIHPDDRIPEPPGTRHRDYILTDYTAVGPQEGRLHSATALRHCLRVHGMLSLWPAIASARDLLGPGETVWGFKWKGADALGVELYFYNSTRNAPPNPKRVSALVSHLAPLVPIDSRLDEATPYFMCSLELAPSEASPRFRVYLSGERLRDGYDGISYRLDGDEPVLENYYTFYRRDRDLETVRSRVAASIRSGDAASQGALLPPHLTDCHTICYATKPHHDALYFSRVSTNGLRHTLEAHVPGPVAALFSEEAAGLAHLRWDIGWDFRRPHGLRASVVEKIGFYGFL